MFRCALGRAQWLTHGLVRCSVCVSASSRTLFNARASKYRLTTWQRVRMCIHYTAVCSVPTDRQWLIYKGSILSETATLTEFKFPASGAILNLIVRRANKRGRPRGSYGSKKLQQHLKTSLAGSHEMNLRLALNVLPPSLSGCVSLSAHAMD